MKTRCVILLILCLICCLALISCTREISLEAPMEDYDGELVSVIDGTETSYSIVRSDLAEDGEIDCAIYLRQELNERFGVKFSLATDFVRKGQEIPTDTKEILVGMTNRPESIEAAKGLGLSDFVVSFSENRIVIIGGSDDATQSAVEYFLEKICVDDAKLDVPKELKLLSRADYRIDGITLKGKNVSEYSLRSDSEVAMSLAFDNFAALAGAKLGEDGEGDSVVLRLADENRVFFEGNDLVISGKNELSLVYGIAALFDKFTESDAEPLNVELDELDMAFEDLPTGVNSQTFTLFNMARACLVVSRDGNIVGIYDRRNGENHIDAYTTSPFAVLTDEAGKFNSLSFEVEGDTVTVGFGEKSRSFAANVTDDFVTFELLDELAEDESLRFLNMNLDKNKEAVDEDDFSVNDYSMTYYLNPSNYPSGVSRSIGLTTFGKFESKGAVGALIASPKGETTTVIKAANTHIVDGMIGYNDKGGANALDYEPTRGDYVIVQNSDKSQTEKYIELGTTYNIKQFDFHKGGNTFINGSFEFTKNGSAEGFKEEVADPLKEHGILAGFHVYSFYIDTTAVDILSDPEAQSQLMVMNEYTLASDIPDNLTKITLSEEHSIVLHENASAGKLGTNYFLVDQEIFRLISVGDDGALYVNRGQCGTKAAPHSANSKVKHLGGVYGGIAPDLDSDLYLQMARNTADAYNRGGFSMIYLDAFDGLSRHTSDIWYYAAKYVNELLKYTEEDPILEYSFMIPSLWISRSRAGAWDCARRAYKLGVDYHVDSNMDWFDMYYPSILGWHNFYPTDNEYPGNTNVEYQYFDDVDHLGVQSIAYDMSFAHNAIGHMETHPALVRNMEQYTPYSRLREENYFSDEIKEKIKDGEYALLDKGNGEYVFVEKNYVESTLDDISEYGTIDVSNPFDAQTPFIRIEGRQTTLGDDAEVLVESQDGSAGKLVYTTVGEPRDIKAKTALRYTVTGNGSKDGSICVRLTDVDGGIVDYLIPVNFEGTRTVVVCEPDNGKFDMADYGLKSSFVPYCRRVFAYDKLADVTVKTKGDVSGAVISDIEVCTPTANTLTKPSITVDGKTIVFDCTIASDEYLEYYLETNTAKLFDAKGNFTEVEVTGELSAPNGEFTAQITADGENADAPARMTVTFGFTGDEVK